VGVGWRVGVDVGGRDVSVSLEKGVSVAGDGT
jgi:hypothetical protein